MKMADIGQIGTPFFRENLTILAKDLKLLGTVGDSVGLIVIERSEDGYVFLDIATGFLVGDGYFMTAYHVFENKINDILENIDRFMPDDERGQNWIQSQFPEEPGLSMLSALTKHVEREKSVSFEDFTREMDPEEREQFNAKLDDKWDQCHVAFWKSNTTDDTLEETTIFFSQCIPFADKLNDVIILKISTDSLNRLPKGLILQEEYDKRDKLSLYGYLKHEGREELHLDPQCLIYIDPSALDRDIENAKQWWQEKEQEIVCESYMKMNFDEEFKNCSSLHNKDNGCFTMHASDEFVQGTSGSPLVFIKKIGNERRPVVTGMYQRGFPGFYYRLQNSIKTHELLHPSMKHYNKFRGLLEMNEKVPLKHFFEAGITMERVANVLGESGKRSFQLLKEAIFSTKKVQDDPESSINVEDTDLKETLQTPATDELRRNRTVVSESSSHCSVPVAVTLDYDNVEKTENPKLDLEEINLSTSKQEKDTDRQQIPLEIIVRESRQEESITDTPDEENNKSSNPEENGNTEHENEYKAHYHRNNTGHTLSLERSENDVKKSDKTRVQIETLERIMRFIRGIRCCRNNVKRRKKKILKWTPIWCVNLSFLILAAIWIATLNKQRTTMTKEADTALHNQRFIWIHKGGISRKIDSLETSYKFPAVALIILAFFGSFLPIMNDRLIIINISLVITLIGAFIFVLNLDTNFIAKTMMVTKNDTLEQYHNNDMMNATFGHFLDMFVCCGITNNKRSAEYVPDGCCSKAVRPPKTRNFKSYPCCYIKAKEFHDTNKKLANILAALAMFVQLLTIIYTIYLKRKKHLQRIKKSQRNVFIWHTELYGKGMCP